MSYLHRNESGPRIHFQSIYIEPRTQTDAKIVIIYCEFLNSIYYRLFQMKSIIKTNQNKFVRLSYEILAIEGITNTDKIVLAYNWGDWGKGGYFATNKYAAGALSMNIKTFEKSALKLKKLGLWKVRGTFIEPNVTPSPVGPAPTQVDSRPTPAGPAPARVGCAPVQVGIESADLPLETEVLLDNLLYNNLEKDKIDILENAGKAANSKYSDAFLNNPEYLKTTKAQTASVSETNYNETISTSEASISIGTMETFENTPQTARAPSREEMIAANWDACWSNKPEPYCQKEIEMGRPMASEEKSHWLDLESQRLELKARKRP